MTAFRDIFGDNPKIRVLEYLLEGRELDHSISDIAEGAGISRITLFRLWKDLMKADVLVHTRKIGNAKMFKLNIKNPRIMLIASIFDKIIKEEFAKSRKKVLRH